MLVISGERNLGRIPALLEEIGCSGEKKEAVGHTIYTCKKDQAEAYVAVAPKQTWHGSSQSPRTIEFYPVFVSPKPGFFRWLFQGSRDRQLQEEIVKALEPLRDLEIQIRM
jgi:hypothetical protein